MAEQMPSEPYPAELGPEVLSLLASPLWGHAHSTGSPGTDWEPVSLMGEGARLVALQPTEAPHLQHGGCKDRGKTTRGLGEYQTPLSLSSLVYKTGEELNP